MAAKTVAKTVAKRMTLSTFMDRLSPWGKKKRDWHVFLFVSSDAAAAYRACGLPRPTFWHIPQHRTSGLGSPPARGRFLSA
jgi:hypothetical protein